MIKVKSIYARPAEEDGERIFVDPLWADNSFTRFAKIDTWQKDLAPSYDTFRFHFDVENWDNYVEAYRKELQEPERAGILKDLRSRAASETITLIHGSKDAMHNNAVILKAVIEEN